MPYDVQWAAGLDDDLAGLDDDSFNAWKAVIDAIFDSHSVRDLLTIERGYQVAEPRFDCQHVAALCARNFNIARLKLFPPAGPPLPHRLLYALDHRHPRPAVVLLGLMPRWENYDQLQPTVQRCLRDYDALGIPQLLRH